MKFKIWLFLLLFCSSFSAYSFTFSPGYYPGYHDTADGAWAHCLESVEYLESGNSDPNTYIHCNYIPAPDYNSFDTTINSSDGTQGSWANFSFPAICSSGKKFDPITGMCSNAGSPSSKNKGKSDCPNACEGNPINTATGNKFQTETDFVLPLNIGLEFHRYYNSQEDPTRPTLGSNWRSSWQQSIASTPGSTVAKTIDADGREDIFTKNSLGIWQALPSM